VHEGRELRSELHAGQAAGHQLEQPGLEAPQADASRLGIVVHLKARKQLQNVPAGAMAVARLRRELAEDLVLLHKLQRALADVPQHVNDHLAMGVRRQTADVAQRKEVIEHQLEVERRRGHRQAQ
jgi:hypothetical protein